MCLQCLISEEYLYKEPFFFFLIQRCTALLRIQEKKNSNLTASRAFQNFGMTKTELSGWIKNQY
jgi:hypothetical protein